MTATVALMDTSATEHCHSCGDTSDGLVGVRRLYVMTPEPAFGAELAVTPGAEPVVIPGDDEVWCEVCRIHYPHELLNEPG